MKKFLQQPINFAYAAIVMMVLTFGVGLATASYTLPGEDPTPLIHAGGGEQPINNLKIGGSCMGLSCSIIGAFDARGLANAVAYFGDTGSNLFFGFGDMYNLGTLFIGMGNNSNGDLITASPQIAIWNAPVNGLSAPLQKVNVSGNVRAVNLNNSGGLPEVCVAKTGTLILCPLPNPIHGVCGGADGPPPVSTPPTSDLCSAGTPSVVTTGLDSYDWYCYGSNGGETASCSAPKTVTYTYHWFTGEWGPCSGASGSCSGNPTTPGGQGAKVDWNGDPLEWQNGKVYVEKNDGSIAILADCLVYPNPDNNFDLSVGKNLDINASNNGIACYVQHIGSYPGVAYEPSLINNLWHRLELNNGLGGVTVDEGGGVSSNANVSSAGFNPPSPLYQTGREFRARCDINKDGTINNSDQSNANCTPGNPGANSTVELQQGFWQGMNNWCAPIHTTNFNAPAKNRNPVGAWNAGWNPQIPKTSAQGYQCIVPSGISCSGLPQTQCSGVPGCAWQGLPGTQNRIVECRNQYGINVSDNLCTEHVGPKPPSSQPCW